MAIDTHKEIPSAPNPLKMAMNRAGDMMTRKKDGPEEDTLELTEALERRPFRRVEVKLEVLSYINAQFRQRTASDGTVLAPSLELLVEQLTDLVMNIEAKAST